MCKTIALSLVLLGAVINVSAQTWTRFLNGSFHRPTLLMDESGNFLPPFLLYQDHKVETYIPDFTGTAESQTRPAQFKRNGQYEFILYTYSKATHKTNRSLIVGNAETGEIHLHQMDATGGLFGPIVDYHHNTGLPQYLDHSILAYMKLMVYLHETEGTGSQ